MKASDAARLAMRGNSNDGSLRGVLDGVRVAAVDPARCSAEGVARHRTRWYGERPEVTRTWRAITALTTGDTAHNAADATTSVRAIFPRGNR